MIETGILRNWFDSKQKNNRHKKACDDEISVKECGVPANLREIEELSHSRGRNDENDLTINGRFLNSSKHIFLGGIMAGYGRNVGSDQERMAECRESMEGVHGLTFDVAGIQGFR
jgi:hypothetical protein